jgi:hypothetical protein
MTISYSQRYILNRCPADSGSAQSAASLRLPPGSTVPMPESISSTLFGAVMWPSESELGPQAESAQVHYSLLTAGIIDDHSSGTLPNFDILTSISKYADIEGMKLRNRSILTSLSGTILNFDIEVFGFTKLRYQSFMTSISKRFDVQDSSISNFLLRYHC